MKSFWLRLKAPFAAFRGFQAGVYRSTAPIIPPSTAFGLVLNLASIEMRDDLNNPTTLIRKDLPRLRIAVGTTSKAEKATLYQQLHTYPVGNSGKQQKQKTYGAKYWITPVKREVLVDFTAVIGVEAEDDFLFERVRLGLRGELDQPRYGLPFAGDNNFLFDHIDIISEPSPETYWYCRMQPEDPPQKGSCRLTTFINRLDNSETLNYLYAPSESRSETPPETAWSWIPSSPEPSQHITS